MAQCRKHTSYSTIILAVKTANDRCLPGFKLEFHGVHPFGISANQVLLLGGVFCKIVQLQFDFSFLVLDSMELPRPVEPGGVPWKAVFRILLADFACV